MKIFKSAVKNGLLELLNQKILVDFIFIGIIFLDALGAILPVYLDRKVTMFAAFPLIFLIYLLNAKKASRLFIISLCFNFLGICNFNNPYEKYNSTGLIYYAIALLIYCVILFRSLQGVSMKMVLKLSIPMMLIVVIPAIIYSDGMSSMLILKETLLYVIFATIFVFSAFLKYIIEKTKVNYILLLSAISIVVSAYFQGYNLFMKGSDILRFSAVIFFNLTHYFMCLYLLKKADKLSCKKELIEIKK